MAISFSPLGDNAVLIEFGREMDGGILKQIRLLTGYLDENPPPWMIEYIPAYTTVAVIYDPLKAAEAFANSQPPYDNVRGYFEKFLPSLDAGAPLEQRTVDIPVCYGGEYGPDLEFVARINGLTAEEVIRIHASGDYLVYMIGFAPGFPYVGGMSKRIAAPRRETPRLKIPAGSVGIAGEQTGIYPIETPGGWRIIGRTPVRLFDPGADPPSLLKAGDRIKFFPISAEEFKKWESFNR